MGVNLSLELDEFSLDNSVQDAVNAIQRAHYVVALTGAGISAESGLPTFRNSHSSLWSQHSQHEIGSLQGFTNEPAALWEVIENCFQQHAKPNAAHQALAVLERAGKLQCIITQNVDSFHQEAGSKTVIPFHGELNRILCTHCSRAVQLADVLAEMKEKPPLCNQCHNVLRPDIVLFGEAINADHLAAAEQHLKQCDLLLVIGTSALIEPAASIPIKAKRNGARVLCIDTTETAVSEEIADLALTVY